MEVREKVSNEDLQAYLKTLVEKSKVAQKQFERDYTKQRPIDEVVRAIGKAVCDNGKTLGEEAFAETGMGNVESKIAKLTNVALLQWVQMRGKNSVEYEDCPGEPGVKYLPKPMGVIGAVMPSTNPIATKPIYFFVGMYVSSIPIPITGNIPHAIDNPPVNHAGIELTIKSVTFSPNAKIINVGTAALKKNKIGPK